MAKTKLKTKKLRIEEYLLRRTTARETRDDVCRKLAPAVRSLLQDMEQVERTIIEGMSSFRQMRVIREKATRDYGAAWRLATGHVLGPLPRANCLYWYTVKKKGGPPDVCRRPTNQQLRRAYLPECEERLMAARDTLHEASATLGAFHDKYNRLNTAISKGGVYFTGVIPKTSIKTPAWIPETLRDSYEQRGIALERLGMEIEARLVRVNQLESELDGLMREFNSHGDRWQNHLTAVWRLPLEEGHNVTGGSGLHFCKLRKSPGKRLLVRIRGKITRELIRESGQGRYEEELMGLYRKIIELSEERNQINQSFVEIYNILQAYMQNYKEQ